MTVNIETIFGNIFTESQIIAINLNFNKRTNDNIILKWK